MIKFLVVLLSALIMSTQVYAGDYRFETTSEGIVNALTFGQQPLSSPAQQSNSSRIANLKRLIIKLTTILKK